jgi:carbonic anhydrase/acetyltransferase-like protein (isoleucine patch superfamily)
MKESTGPVRSRRPARRKKPRDSAGSYLDRTPRLGKGVFIAPGARLIGDVSIGDGSSVWFNAVLRADINRITIGERTNVQDNAVLHLADDYGCQVGDWVTIGHSAVVHACELADQVLVGMGAIVLDGAFIGAQSMIGAGTLVPQHLRVPEGVLVLGRPGLVVRSLTRVERTELKRLARKYHALAREYRLRAEGRASAS